VNLADLVGRIRRLEQLSRGLTRELTLWKACNDPLLYLERRTYLGQIQNASKAIEAARALLVQVQQRLENERSRQAAR
jgi:hypothetical protein